MFLQIVRGDGRKRTIECSMVDETVNGKDTILFQLWHGRKNFHNVEVSKKDGSEVYILNSEGKTIDTYRWAIDGDGIPQSQTNHN